MWGLWCFWKVYKKTKIVMLEQTDIWSGRREVVESRGAAVGDKRKTLSERIKDVVVG